MSVATGSSEAAGGAGGGGGARVFFQSPRGGAGGSPGSSGGSGSSREDSAPVATAAAAGQVQQQQQQQQQRRHQQGKVTVKYDRKELRKRLVLEEWIVEQLGQLYGCEVLGRGAGRVGASLAPLCPHRDSPAPALGCAPPRLLGTRRWERGAGRSLSRVPSGAGARRLGAPVWCRVPGELRALFMAVGRVRSG
uniref:protein phosphatase 1 regulatory subunit 14C n=1 Tax=Panthera onca TaxID=9690 RepID=UPI0029550982|nr:protein phosphatase 1 regulatory subunit 14C [Panthera onca]